MQLMNNLMRKFFILFSLLILSIECIPSVPCGVGLSDTIESQILNNGRAWRNLYYKIKGDQFLFSTEFLPGTVTIEGRTFNSLRLKYDIYNDELIMITDHGIIIQINKEMVESFSMVFDNFYNFKKIEADTLNSLTGYVNVLYDGITSLYIKYRKEILQLAVENKYDMFNQVNRIFVEKNGQIFRVDSKRELLKLLEDQKRMVHSFIRSSKLRISMRNPDSFRPVIEYYDRLQH
jgi:hypothetical protein